MVGGMEGTERVDVLIALTDRMLSELEDANVNDGGRLDRRWNILSLASRRVPNLELDAGLSAAEAIDKVFEAQAPLLQLKTGPAPADRRRFDEAIDRIA